jgi:thiamine kinase-like enzyme
MLRILVLIFTSYCLQAEEPINTAEDLLGCSISEDTQFISLSGMTNKSYLFNLDENKYVIRIPGEGTNRFIDRSFEQLNSKEAYLMGLSPTYPIAFNSFTGSQLTEYVADFENFQFENFYQDDLIAEIAQLLLKIHTSSLPFKNYISLFDRMDQLELYLLDKKISLPREYLSIRSVLKDLISLDCFEQLPSHGDPVPSNIIKLDDKLMLFDWEYSGLNDPAYDLAFLSTVMNYSQQQEERLLHYYKMGPISILREKIIYFKPIIESWLGLWGTLQTVSCKDSQKDFFNTFSAVRFKRAEKILYSEEYAKAIKLLTSLHNKDDRWFFSFPIDSEVPLLASFPRLSEEIGLSQIEFGLWICPYCGILNPMTNSYCICPNCPLK